MRRRVRIGDIQAEARAFSAQRAVQLRVGASSVVLVVALDGGGELICESGRVSVDLDTVVLLGHGELATTVWRADSCELVLHLSRQPLHALASAAYGGGRRLSSAGPWTICLERAEALRDALLEVRSRLCNDAAEIGPSGRELERRLQQALLDGLVRTAPTDEVLPLSRSVTEAMRRVREAPDQAWDAQSLAAAVGVTVPVLRRNFRAILGMSVGALVLQTRLTRAHDRLASAHDSRPLSLVAQGVGFRTPGSFSRAYTRLFGESPSETRARAVRNNQTKNPKSP
ncbi:MAG TPA: helix-turn-helix domain-containing protein [Caulobacteraceae bacterium]|nr:helix-turn-helix domain-containing protein [Caulobacteraceae bacterium]